MHTFVQRRAASTHLVPHIASRFVYFMADTPTDDCVSLPVFGTHRKVENRRSKAEGCRLHFVPQRAPGNPCARGSEMKYRNPVIALLTVLLVQSSPAFAQSNAASGVPAPVYSVAPDWPTVPTRWRLGSVSGVAVDDQDNVWVLHRPRTLPADQAGMAAPPIIVFDTDGNFVKAWGGPGTGYEWPQNEHGVHIDDEGFVWITGNS
jgi:hypothetical protein